MKDPHESRVAGGLMGAGALGALVLMLHHPTSLEGPDDGLLLGDWTNAGVHSGMTACILLLTFGGTLLARRLGEEHLSVRAGRMAYLAGMGAFAGAALINGFAVPDLMAGSSDPEAVVAQVRTLGVLNQTLARFGLALTALALGLWAVRMARMGPVMKGAAALGAAILLLAAGWLASGGGFGLHPAFVAAAAFALWSLTVAAGMLADGPREDRGS